MHWWQLPFSSPFKPESADDIAITFTGMLSSHRSRGRLSKSDVEEWHSSSAMPQPLPLPELQLQLPKIVSHNVPLPSPGSTHSHSGGERYLERGRRRGLDEQLIRLVGKKANVELSESRLTRKSSMKPYAGERSPCSSNTTTPSSDPTSPYSSPVYSPQRSEISTSSHMVSPGVFHVLSASEMPHSNGNTLLSYNYQMPSDKTTALVDESPHSSPKSNSSFHVESLPGPALPLPLKGSSEAPVSRRESNAQANVHTLPLPPGADMPSPPTPAFSNSSASDLSGAILSLPPTPISNLVARNELPGVKRVSPAPQIVNKPIRSQWQKGKLIGRGTFGSVYVASNRETGALCAMKEVEILPEDIKSQECIRQLEQEIKVLSNLKHPNIVQYYGSEIVGDKFYIYLEYVHPGSISKFIHDHCAAITESVVRNFTRHILRGLAYLHSTKTIHRDIKGANLLVDACGVVKLADFGMAKHLSGEAANLSLKGSPHWLAPELLQSAVPKDASADHALAVDIWSLGCTIIEMINGKPPWSDCEGAAALFKVLKETPPIPETLSADGKDFLQRCFCRNPADRPTAMRLLEHPFVNCTSSHKKKDTMQFRRAQPCYKLNQVPASFDQKMKKGKLAIK